MMMTIALRFIPTLMEESDKIRKAQMARGADFGNREHFPPCAALSPCSSSFRQRFRRADDLAVVPGGALLPGWRKPDQAAGVADQPAGLFRNSNGSRSYYSY